MRAVLDTGVLVSGIIRRQGTTGEVVRALREKRFAVIYTTPILVEIIEVLGRNPFRTKYHIEAEDITALVNLIRLRGELVTPKQTVTVCRDAKDNKFLETALAANADAIVSGDDNLLVLNPFEGILFLHPSEFLAKI
jgi:hypothetical protein